MSVLFNLLDNALKYSKEEPAINICLKDTGTHLQMVVADNGIGIPQEYHHRIFEKFFRVPHGNVHDAKGYGLGLSYVSHVVEQHGGTIEVQDSPLGGARFRVTLPVARREDGPSDDS